MSWDDLQERMVKYAASVGRLVDALPETRLGRHIAGQLMRCGTSPAPNYAEACAAESRADFIHKLAIVLKELREACVWLSLIKEAELLPNDRLAGLVDECTQLGKIIGRSIVTARENAARSP